MPPRRFSRFAFSAAVLDAGERLLLTEREPFRFRPLPDTRQHVVQQGDTLFSVAGRYFAPLPRGAGLWWVVADFQPDPIHDPTLALDLGRVLFVPSVRVVTEEVFAEERRREAAP
ncbi:MAG: LysM domain-containing protein [Kofleriaceae bacterium]